MKLAVYSFQSTSGIAFDVYRYLKTQNLEVTFHVSTHLNNRDKDLRSYNGLLFLFHKIVFKILRLIRVRYYWVRHLQELIYDYISSKQLNQRVFLITTSGWIPKTIQKNHQLGGRSIFLCGNPCDLEISRVLDVERENVINIKDIYNFKPRLNTYKQSLNGLDKIIAFNTFCYNSFLNYAPIEKLLLVEKIWPINNKFHNLEKTKKNNKFTFAYIGHTILLKGLHILLDAWEHVENTDVQLIIGGSIQNELNSYFQDRLSKFSNVLYLGKVSDLYKFYNNSDVFICPSLIDAGPLTMIEAMMSELPVIVSENCGISYIIEDGINGFVYKNNSHLDLAKKINWFIENSAETFKMGQAARQTSLLRLNKSDNLMSEIESFYNFAS